MSLGLAGVMGDWQELSCGARAVVGLQQRGDASEAMLRRLEALEADVRFLCTELGAEKLLWSSRFLELLREQQSLHQRVSPLWGPAPAVPSGTPDPHTLFQLQELPWQWNRGDSPELLGEAEDQSASGSEGESPEGRGWELQGAQGTSSWGGGTCNQSWGWGNVLTLLMSSNGQCTNSHLGTGWHWAAWGGTWEEVVGKAPSSLRQFPPGAWLGAPTGVPSLCSVPGRQWMEAPQKPHSSIQPDRQKM